MPSSQGLTPNATLDEVIEAINEILEILNEKLDMDVGNKGGGHAAYLDWNSSTV